MHKFITVLIAIFQIYISTAQVRLPRLVRDSMVLQRDQPLPIWGWASPGERVTIIHQGKKYSGKTDISGSWKILLPPMPAGGPYNMTIAGKNTIVLKDVLFGDVWFCSGQSNMVHQLNIHDVSYAEVIKKANYPEIRQFLVPTGTSLTSARTDLNGGNWTPAVGEAIRPFSAVAFFFARQLFEKYHVPIGIINSSVGGTPIEAWMSMEEAAIYPDLDSRMQQLKDSVFVRQSLSVKPVSDEVFPEKDPGISGKVKWYDPAFEAGSWKRITVPGYWEDLGHADLNGVVWFRNDFVLDDKMKGLSGRLFLGRIVDADEVYLNGVRIGSTTYQYPQRRYSIPEGILKQGSNTLVVRVTNYAGKGGFVPDKQYAICTASDTVDISGEWRFRIGQIFYPSGKVQPAQVFSQQSQPAALFNAMVSPLLPYPIKGICWYQGESNVAQPQKYFAYQQSLIRDWRKQWKNDTLPFIFVQLPGFQSYQYLPSQSNWAMLREAQLKSLSTLRTAMAVAIDLGEWNDIHPDNKKDVGDRMALAARHLAYGDTVTYSGPLFSRGEVRGSEMIIQFNHVAGGLTTLDGEPPASFAIAGEDKKFIPAKARIQGSNVIVWNEKISNPVYVRYAWADNPVQPNLCNSAKLPASPFRTDE